MLSAGGDSGTVYWLQWNGNERATFPTLGPIRTTPVFSTDGDVLVGESSIW